MNNWRALLEPEIKDYIKSHEGADPAKLALSGSPRPEWPFPLILEQIKLRQKARQKLPEFHGLEDYIFISQDLLEQASSQACALYKASLVKGKDFCDLTAGHGIDSYYIAQHFKRSTLIERDSNVAEILQHNMESLGFKAVISCGLAEQYLESLEQVDCMFLDPQRRSGAKKGIFELCATSPDIISLLPILKKKSEITMIKASPFLDISKAIEELKFVKEVHVVQYQDDCKEVLYLLDFNSKIAANQVRIIAGDINEDGKVKKQFQYSLKEEEELNIEFSLPQKYIYEAGPAFMKAGGFKSLAQRYDLKKLHEQTHLYTSDQVNKDFPGKYYKVLDIRPVQAKEIKFKKADLAIRNFPDTVDNLRKKLKLKDGGAHRIYACTLMDNTKKLIICAKS